MLSNVAKAFHTQKHPDPIQLSVSHANTCSGWESNPQPRRPSRHLNNCANHDIIIIIEIVL